LERESGLARLTGRKGRRGRKRKVETKGCKIKVERKKEMKQKAAMEGWKSGKENREGRSALVRICLTQISFLSRLLKALNNFLQGRKLHLKHCHQDRLIFRDISRNVAARSF
jgi:hypothetical protein